MTIEWRARVGKRERGGCIEHARYQEATREEYEGDVRSDVDQAEG